MEIPTGVSELLGFDPVHRGPFLSGSMLPGAEPESPAVLSAVHSDYGDMLHTFLWGFSEKSSLGSARLGSPFGGAFAPQFGVDFVPPLASWLRFVSLHKIP